MDESIISLQASDTRVSIFLISFCVNKLPTRSILQSRAIPMHLGDGWVAVIRLRVLEIYVLDHNKYVCWETRGLPHAIGTASFDSSAHCSL